MNPVNRLKFYDPTILTLTSPKIILMYNHPHWFSLKVQSNALNDLFPATVSLQ